ncbi:uncharacterized protein BDZ99DRAFT_422811 [Mytilinidion resinicola]|uniref:Uncharacterized protein n=1 Tax=Mytilinidion resinicola TaxID=574789 RepID=A0A6A6YEA8_9PEZI|nr:uncharacterized protein BDZ99DRAFT_422811 [Mytilinidion resinicola]KAF2806415.1 hypothetical protein BDZ99DRAFT_422811 [Mytilinidion resinicola]
MKNQGQQWPDNGQMNVQQNPQNIASPEIPQNTAHFNPTPPPQGFPTPSVPQSATTQPPQWTPTPTSAPMSPANQYQIAPINPPQFSPDQVSPPPLQQSGGPPEATPSHIESKPTTSQPPLSSVPPPTEFIAELPADWGYAQSSVNPLSKPTPPPQQYQAYHAPTGSRPQSFSVPRRAISTSSVSAHISTGPWRIVDPSTEQPTPEFFVIADLLFDGLDKKCEPKNTGFLEASKILESWKVQEMADEPARLFMHNNFHAFASLWTLEGIPHVMVPNEPRLTPSQIPLPQSLKISPNLPAPTSTYPSYIPALNRAGWYKYFFLEVVGEREGLEKMLPAFCADTYNPATAGHPDLSRRDKGEPQSLSARANALRTGAIARVCQEAAAAIGRTNGGS